MESKGIHSDTRVIQLDTGLAVGNEKNARKKQKELKRRIKGVLVGSG